MNNIPFTTDISAYVSDIRNQFAFKSDMTEIRMKEFLKEGIFNNQIGK
tara:strand:+ start:7413 stop:7556 length:144 start_codon:yes stop_codon:yes gene_type:complete